MELEDLFEASHRSLYMYGVFGLEVRKPEWERQGGRHKKKDKEEDIRRKTRRKT